MNGSHCSLCNISDNMTRVGFLSTSHSQWPGPIRLAICPYELPSSELHLAPIAINLLRNIALHLYRSSNVSRDGVQMCPDPRQWPVFQRNGFAAGAAYRFRAGGDTSFRRKVHRSHLKMLCDIDLKAASHVSPMCDCGKDRGKTEMGR